MSSHSTKLVVGFTFRTGQKRTEAALRIQQVDGLRLTILLFADNFRFLPF